jgi:predicted ester cyclase
MNAEGSKDTAKELIRDWIKGLWDRGDVALFDEFAAAEYVYRRPGYEDVHGRGVFTVGNEMRTAFPDLENTIGDQFVDGDTVVSLGISRGTHQGVMGELSPTGNPIELSYAYITKVQDGCITEDLEIFDTLHIALQIGAVSTE